MVKITISLDGEKQLGKSFEYVRRGLVDFRQLGAWDAVQSVFYKIEKEIFASEGGSGASGKWKSLSSPYKERKLKKWGNVPILTASGKLYRSLTSAGASGAVVEKTKDTLTLGTTVPYARYHQKGGGRLPKRSPIDITADQKGQLAKPIQDKLRQLIANAKLRDLRGF